jgi:hypothetical protein
LVATELPAVARPAERTAGSDRHFEQCEIEPAVESAAPGAQEFGIADGQKVALQLDIEVVFDGEGESVLQREVEVSRADEFVYARRIFESHGGRGPRHSARNARRHAGRIATLGERQAAGQKQRQ